jgi:hypothetical protein
MKNSTTFAIVVVWFSIFGALAFGLDNPQLISSTQIVSGSIENLTTILCLTVPFGALAIVTMVAFIWHKETELTKLKKSVKA